MFGAGIQAFFIYIQLVNSSVAASETLKIKLNQTIMLEPQRVAQEHYSATSKVTSKK